MERCLTSFSLCSSTPLVTKFAPPFILSHFDLKKGCGVCGDHFRADISPFALDPARPWNLTDVLASRFMTYTPVLKDQTDYINALSMGYKIADGIAANQSIAVAPYSVFYVRPSSRCTLTARQVFFEQYLSIYSVATLSIGLAMGLRRGCVTNPSGAIFLITSALLRSFSVALIITFCVALVQVRWRRVFAHL
jgi:hypothetical protein